METVLSAVLIDAPRAAAIWFALMLLAAITSTGLVTGRIHSRIDGGRVRRAALPEEIQHKPEIKELARYAQEVAVAAERAAVTAGRRREEWLAIQAKTEAAWWAYDSADAAARRLTAAATLPIPRTPQTPAEYAERERYLHRAALTAYWRRELTVEELSDVFAHRDGWDPRRHPVEQELHLGKRVRANLLAAYRAAAERERKAWREAEMAAVAAQSLQEEARTAAERAEQARQRPEWVDERGLSLFSFGQPAMLTHSR